MEHVMSDSEVRIINEKLNRVLGFLNNDKDTNTPGLVQQVRDIRSDLDKLIDSIKLERERRKVWGIIFGGIGAGLVWLIQKLISHFI